MSADGAYRAALSAQIVGAAAGLLILGGLWTPVVGVLAGMVEAVDRFHPTRNSVPWRSCWQVWASAWR